MCNVTSNVTNSEVLWYSYFILLVLLGFPLVLVGIGTSLLSFIMFFFDRFTPQSTKLMLKTLSMVDAIYLICVIVYVEFKAVYRLYPATHPILGFMEKQTVIYNILVMLVNCCELFRNWGTVLIGVERYLVTCHPFQASSWCTSRNTFISLCVCGVATLFLRVPMAVRLLTKDSNHTHMRDLSDVAIQVHNYIDSIFLTILPLILLAYCSVRITRAIVQSHNSVSNDANSHIDDALIQRRRLRVTRMLSVVLIIFFICGVPSLLNISIPYLATEILCISNSDLLPKIIVTVCWFMNIVFSTSNFFVYVIYMPKYRQILKRLLLCRNVNSRGPDAHTFDASRYAMERSSRADIFQQPSRSGESCPMLTLNNNNSHLLQVPRLSQGNISISNK